MMERMQQDELLAQASQAVAGDIQGRDFEGDISPPTSKNLDALHRQGWIESQNFKELVRNALKQDLEDVLSTIKSHSTGRVIDVVEAADASIESLRAENQRLRSALAAKSSASSTSVGGSVGTPSTNTPKQVDDIIQVDGGQPTMQAWEASANEHPVAVSVHCGDLRCVALAPGAVHDEPTEAPPDAKKRNSKTFRPNVSSASFATSGSYADEDAQDSPFQMFQSNQAMKETIRKSIMKEAYNVFDFYHEEGIMQRIAKSPLFEQVTLIVICLNAIWIAVDTDYNKASMLIDAQPIFIAAENFFCFFFFVEWLVRWMAFQKIEYAMRDKWFIFDSVLLVMFMLEVWVLTLVMTISGNTGSVDKAGDASILRVFRLIRLTRMARVAKLFRLVPELMIMIKGMVVAMRSVLVTLTLLTLVLYIFAIAFTQMLSGATVGTEYFSTVAQSMNSLIAYGIIMEDTPTVLNALGEESLFFGGMLLLFILLASFTVLNMLVGVMCETVRVVATVENEQITVTYAKERLSKLMEESGLDQDGDFAISKDEFNKLLELPDACRTLHVLGVDVEGLVDLADFIFEDAEYLEFPQFMQVVLQLRGSNSATVKDLVDFRKCIQKDFAARFDEQNAMLEPSAKFMKGKSSKSLVESFSPSLKGRASTCQKGAMAGTIC